MAVSEIEGSWIAEVRKNSRMLILFGILTVIFGIIAVAWPLITGLWVAMFVGGLLVVTGILRIVHAIKSGRWGIGILGTIIGVLTVVVGFAMLARPVYGLAMVTLVVAAYFVIDGIFEIIAAFKIRPDAGWGWMLFGGIVALLLGGMMWQQWPASAQVIGILVGIHILVSGWSMIMMGSVGSGLAAEVKETMEDVAEAVDEAVDDAKEAVDKVQDVAGDVVDKTKEVVGDAVDAAKDAADDVVDAAKDAVDKVKGDTGGQA